MSLIKRDRSVVVACDVPTVEKLDSLVKETCKVEGIGGYKVGFELALTYGLPVVVKTIRKRSRLPIIYDHQKAGTDVPFTGSRFAKICKDSGVDAVILFPQAGPETASAWIEACKKINLGVMVGGEMTHPKYKQSEGGYIRDDAFDEIYTNAARMGVTEFIVPGNKPERIKHYREILERLKIQTVFYAPGFIEQGGRITDAGKQAGRKWHAIVGRAIYDAPNMKKAAEELVKEIL